AAADECLRPPQSQDRAFDLLPGGKGLLVMNQVGARARAVVAAVVRRRHAAPLSSHPSRRVGGSPPNTRRRALEASQDTATVSKVVPSAAVILDELRGFLGSPRGRVIKR